MINNRTLDRNKLNCLKSFVCRADDESNKYAHHPSIKSFNGKYYASWSSGVIGEDEPCQCIMYAVSDDLLNWSKPKCLFDPIPNGVLTNCGFWVDDDRLIAYAGYYEYIDNVLAVGENHINTTLFYKTSNDGETWSEMIDLKLPIVPNFPPKLTKTNKLMMCGNISVALTESHDGLSGWRIVPLPPYEKSFTFDDSAAITYLKEEREDKVFLCEIGAYEYGEKLIALLRSDTDCLFACESNNNGETWSYPQKTEFTDYHSKFCCGTLNDGRNYVVSNPDSVYCRLPLVLSLAKDGENFDEQYVLADEMIPMRYPSKYKGGYYAYPSCEYVDGKLIVICSVNKEDILIISVNENELRC